MFWLIVCALLFAVGVLVIFLNSFTIVQPKNVGIVTTFGKSPTKLRS